MNTLLLIDAIVRQTTVLIAQLATSAGMRAPLAHITADVFLSLAEELKAQGITNKVIADMFGVALRTYHNRIRRYSESQTQRGSSLWMAVLADIRSRNVVAIGHVEKAFHADDSETVRAVLKDLVDAGLIYKKGRGRETTFRAVTVNEASTARSTLTQFVWVLLHQLGPSSPAEVGGQLGVVEEEIEAALESLLAEGRVRRCGGASASRFEATSCLIPYGDERGWEAAVFDHYQAVVTGIAVKVRSGHTVANQDDVVGGSTYCFDLHAGHPMEREVRRLLSETREKASNLRKKVLQEAVGHSSPYRVVFYTGQYVIEEDER